jgi:hypothetical protein
MFARREEVGKWLLGVIEKFREKGVVGPDRAMTAEELACRRVSQKQWKGDLGVQAFLSK